MPNTDPICIYHKNCADGFAGAWVVRQHEPAAEFHAAAYGDAPPPVEGRTVILVDFSYPRAVMEQIAEAADALLVFDHHATAITDLQGFEIGRLNTLLFLDNNRSGSRIAWDYYTDHAEPPKLLQHIEDRDLWRFALPETRLIQACLFSHPYDFSLWDALMAKTDLADMAMEGQAIERKHLKDIDELLAVTARPMSIAGHVVPVANLPYTMANDVAGRLAENMPFAATYYDTEKERVFSLRSAPDGINVGEIAKSMGGGGHQHAAGFRTPLPGAGAALPQVRPDTLGVDLTPGDQERLDRAIELIQQHAPGMEIDACINLIFSMGLSLTETAGGIDIAKTCAALNKMGEAQ